MEHKIALFYTGIPRFKNETIDNHKKLFNRLEKHFNIQIYDFTTSQRKNCPFDPTDIDARGSLQVWDFAKGLERISENIVVRLRTDLWFTNSSIDAIINQTNEILENKISASFFQFSKKVHRNSNDEYVVNLTNGNGVGDFVIAANRTKILSPDNILKKNSIKKIYSGNWAFENILLESTNANNVSAKIYLVRQNEKVLSDEQVFLDFTQFSLRK